MIMVDIVNNFCLFVIFMWLIFLNDELLFWTEQEEWANFNDIPEEDRANCEILKNVEGFTGIQLVRLIVDGSGNKIPEVYERPPPQLD